MDRLFPVQASIKPSSGSSAPVAAPEKAEKVSAYDPRFDPEVWNANQTLRHPVPIDLNSALGGSTLLSAKALNTRINQLCNAVSDKRVPLPASLQCSKEEKQNVLIKSLLSFRKVAMAAVKKCTEDGPIQSDIQYQLLIGGLGTAVQSSAIQPENPLCVSLQAHLDACVRAWFSEIEKQLCPKVAKETTAETEEKIPAAEESITPEPLPPAPKIPVDALVEAMSTANVSSDKAREYVSIVCGTMLGECAERQFHSMRTADTQPYLEKIEEEIARFAGSCTQIVEQLIVRIIGSESTPSLQQLNALAAEASAQVLALPDEGYSFLSPLQRETIVREVYGNLMNTSIDAADLFVETSLVSGEPETSHANQESAPIVAPHLKGLRAAAEVSIAHRIRSEERKRTHEAREALPLVEGQLTNELHHIQTLMHELRSRGGPREVAVLQDLEAYLRICRQELESRMRTPE